MSFSKVEELARSAGATRHLSRKALLLHTLRLQRARRIDPKLRQLLAAKAVRGLFLHAPGVLILDALIAVGVAIVFWREGQEVIGAWLALMLGTIILRWLHVVRYFDVERPATEVRRWARLFAFGSFMSGLQWGVGSVTFFAPESGPLLIVQVFLVTGLCAGALTGYAAHMPSFYAFVPAAVLPFGVCLAITGVPAHLFTAALLAVWLSVIVLLAHLLNRHIADRLLLVDRAMLAETMERSRDAADAANQAKTRLLASVSHELRTPLNAIIGFSDIMSSERFGLHNIPRYLEYSRDIKASGLHLLHMVNDILDVAKLEAGGIRLNESTISVDDLLAEIERMLRFSANHGNVGLTTFSPRDLSVRVDGLRFRQVLINLVSNAVKFTPSGGRVAVIAAVDGSGDLSIQVRDNGIGMRKADIAKALEPFVQLDQLAPRGDTGTGLGLALAKIWVEAHGGTLQLESELGFGTTATIRMSGERVLWTASAADAAGCEAA